MSEDEGGRWAYRVGRWKRGRPLLGLWLTWAFLTVGLTTTLAHSPGGPMLVKIRLRSSVDLAHVEAARVPAYAWLTDGEGGPTLLAGALPRQIATLRRQGLWVSVLDPQTRGARYYLVTPRGARHRALLHQQGEILSLEGPQVLIRSTPDQAAGLVEAGLHVAPLGLEAIALQPRDGVAISSTVQAQPIVEAMIAQVELAALQQYENWLTGEEPVQIGGQPYTLLTRHTDSGTPIQKTTQFAFEHLSGLGLQVEYHQWAASTNPNVIATKSGLVDPDSIYILSAHLDDMPASPPAPGADDNASGSTGVLVAADILSQYDFGCTLKFALWTGEEQGMLGSDAWAEWAGNQGLRILGVLNLDMIAYDGLGGPVVDLHAQSHLPASVAIANLFVGVVDAYGLNLAPEVLVDNWLGNYSDNKSFWDEGYAAILAIEDYDDFTPHYHTVNDRLAALNMPYFAEFVKASLATVVHMSGCLIQDGTGHLDGHVTMADRTLSWTSSVPIAGASVAMEGDKGGIFSTLTDSSGYYTHTLSAETYTVTASALGYLPAIVSDVLVLSGTVTAQNFVLQPIPTAVTTVVRPTSLEASLQPDEMISKTLWVTNASDLDLVFRVEEQSAPPQPEIPWLSESPQSGIVAPQEETSVTVTFDARGLEPQVYSGFLDIESTEPVTEYVRVPVTLTVQLPCVPVTDLDFGWVPRVPAAGETTTFTAVASGTPPITFTWDFGDGQVGEGREFRHSYAGAGTYMATVAATNCAGFPAAAAQTVTVAPRWRIHLPLILQKS